ncbi:WecB/TagA/CpsF family glycosyltransferase [Rhodococcus sp. NPDC003348]
MVVDQIPVDLLDRESAIELIFDALEAAGSLAVASANLDHIHHFGTDASWANHPPAISQDGAIAEEQRWLTLLDGVPLVRKAKTETGRTWPKLSGSDLLEPILARSAADGVRVGFLGGSPTTHRHLLTAMAERFPTLETVGAWAPERSVLTNSAASMRLALEIREARVEILVVSLGKPLQENWISEFGPVTGARALLAFGAAVDFLAGRVRRAPQWVADAGLEWAWRLSREPRRLAHRYLVEAPPSLLRLECRSRATAAVPPRSDRVDAAQGRFVAPGDQAEVAVVVVTYNSESDLPGLIEGLRVTAADRAVRVIVADNQSYDGTVTFIENQPDIEVVRTGGNLGYAGGINAALPLTEPSTAVLILNPDILLHCGAVTHLLAALDDPHVGAVVPLILDSDGAVYHSVRREPSVSRTVGDALFGRRMRRRPAVLSEIDHCSTHYLRSHDIDWATGAAVLVRSSLIRHVGDWNEEFFLYSEETDYFRRIRDAGYRVRFEPAAVVTHRGGGSGSSSELTTLLSVNRVRYSARFHSAPYSALLRGSVALSELLRSYDADHRRTLAVLLNRKRWADLPAASKSVPDDYDSAQRGRGAVIVPAYNEADVIERTLAPLSGAATRGVLELVVVCNGCRDRTAEIARAVQGTTVLELGRGSKPAALDAGDKAATWWPRIYLDADIQISAAAVLQVLDRLAEGDVLAARPVSRYDHRCASTLVRSYFRARERIPEFRTAMWGAGVYGLNESGHQRVGRFSDHVADDLFVDAQFAADEKTVVPTPPSVVTTPTDAKNLLRILRRWHRGTIHEDRLLGRTSGGTVRTLLHTIRGPGSAADAVVYAGMALAARWNPGTSGPPPWERDASSRSGRMRPRRDSPP